MKYLLPERKTAANHGFSSITHTSVGECIILNEKEVMAAPSLHGDLNERAATLGCTVLTRADLKELINHPK